MYRPDSLRTMSVDPALLHRLFYPQVPAVLSVQYRNRVSAMPVVSYSSVSDRPPLVSVACKPVSFTCKLLVKARSFSLCLLDVRFRGNVERLAGVSGAAVRDKLKEAGLGHNSGRALKVPVIIGASATLECKVRESAMKGDHLLLIGEVEASRASRAFTDFWDFKEYRPILYTGWRDGMTTLSL